MMGPLIHELLIILAAGLIAGLVCRRLHISVLVGYLIVGALLGKGCLGWVSGDRHELEYIAEVGVFFLLFSIGLEFSLNELARLGKNLVIGGTVQMLLVALPVAAFLLSVGIPLRPAILFAAATSFSSTVLIFKALTEWGHASLPHGRRAIGILLFQDVALIPLLLVVPLLTGGEQSVEPITYLLLALKSALFVAAVIVLNGVLAKWIIPTFAEFRSIELVILFTLVSLGGVTMVAQEIGLPPAIGAFAAGLIFSGNRWTRQIDALVLPFRESFAAVFFVSLGLFFNPLLIWNEPLFTFGALLGLILIKTVAATVALWVTGVRSRAALGMGLGLAHIGEFAFVLLMLGWEKGVISETNYGRMVTLAIGSLVLTPLLLKTGLRWMGSVPGTDETPSETSPLEAAGQKAVVIGAGPIGRQVTSQLETLGRDVCLIDLSPINLQGFAQVGFRTIAGDATEHSILKHASADEASLVVVCVPNDEVAIRVVTAIRDMNPEAYVLVRCRYQNNTAKLTKAGANGVVSEEAEASEALQRSLTNFR